MGHPLPKDLGARDWIMPDGCMLCSSPATRQPVFRRVRAEPESLVYRVCRRCGMVFQAPRPSRAWLRRYYRGEYHLHMHGRQTPGDRTSWVEEKRAEQLLAFTQRHVQQVRRHLDIGSSTGRLLAAIQSAYGSDGHGVEPAAGYRQTALPEGAPVVSRLEGLDEGLRNSFDLISLSHVLEHLTDPMRTLRQLGKEWLADGGHLLIEVPNLYAHPSFELAHLSAFTRDTLQRMLKGTGFHVVDLRQHGRPYSRRLPFYILALAEKGPVAPPSSGPPPNHALIRARRWLGIRRTRLVWAVFSRLRSRSSMAPWSG